MALIGETSVSKDEDSILEIATKLVRVSPAMELFSADLCDSTINLRKDLICQRFGKVNFSDLGSKGGVNWVDRDMTERGVRCKRKMHYEDMAS